MKGLLLGIAALVLIALAGFLYRNAVSHPVPITGACTADTKLCPDGSSVARVAPDCNFAVCAPPNVTISSVGLVFVAPPGYSPDATIAAEDPAMLAAYSTPADISGIPGEIISIRDYPLTASTSAADILHATAIGDASGAPVSPSAFSAAHLGDYTYSYVVLGRFEGVVHTAYYLPRSGDVLRFDAIDEHVMNWTDARLDITTLPANAALRALLTTLQIN
jgi:hypothetical protein